MLRTLNLCCVLLLISSWGRAQVLTITPSEFDLVVDAASTIDAHGTMANNSAVDRNITWRRFIEQQPTGWYTTVCDDNNCYSPSTSSMTVALKAYAEGSLKLNIFPNEVPGEAVYRIVAYDATDSANVNASMHIEVTATPVGINVVRQEVATVFPNPVKDVLYINFVSTAVTTVEIYNLVGQRFLKIPVDPSRPSMAIRLSDLKKGVYFLRILSHGKELYTKTFSKE